MTAAFTDGRHAYETGALHGLLLARGIVVEPEHDDRDHLVPVLQLTDASGHKWRVHVLPPTPNG